MTLSSKVNLLINSTAYADHLKKVSQVNDKGLHWCDTDYDGVCHYCGCSGHIAAHCMYNMPQSIKN
jgi:hypothetical protein